MKTIFFTLCALLTTSLLAMNQDRELSYYFTTMPKTATTEEDEIVPIIIKNSTGVPLKIRGRFGPVNNAPLGYICDVNTPNTPQIVYLSNRHAIKFNIKKKYLPLRIRAWQVDFDPDSDITDGKPTFSSERNTKNSLLSVALHHEVVYNNRDQNKLVSLYWDKNSKTFKHKFKTIRTVNPKNCITGGTNHYCVNVDENATCER